MIHDILAARGLELRKKTVTESAGPCPFCGGTDRFCVWPADNRGWCRGCGWAGDDIQLIRDLDGLSFKDAAAKAGHTEKVKSPPKGKDPFIHPDIGKPDRLFWYVDGEGRQLYFTARWNARGDKPKTFRQGKPDGTTWQLKGVKLVLFNLPIIAENTGICFVEGEGKALALQALGIPATCNPMGAGKLVGQQEEHQILEPLRGKRIYVFPDNDAPGKEQGEDLCKLLQGIAYSVKVVTLPDLPPKGDVIDYLAEHTQNPKDLIIEAIKAAPVWAPEKNFFTLEELETLPQERSNHIPIFRQGYFNFGEHIIVAGAGGVGKSLLVLEWALHIAAGADWLDVLKIPQARKVHIMQWENSVREVMLDRAKRMRRGMEEKGIDISGISKRLTFAKRNQYFDLKLKGDQERLMEAVKAAETEVVVYDCLSNMHSGNENDNAHMASVLDVLGHINSACGTSCILIHHYNKPSQEQQAQGQVHTGYRLRGATRIRDWARSLFLYVEEPNRSEVFRRLIMDKCNAGRPFSPVLLVRNDPTDPPEGIDKVDWNDPNATFLCDVSTESRLCPPEKIQEILEQHGTEEGLTSTELWEIVEDEIKCGKSSFYRSLKTALKGKFLKKKVQGKGVRYFSSFKL